MDNLLKPSIEQAQRTTDASDWLLAHGDYLFNLAVGQVRDPLVAEDLVQETFLAAIRARDRFSGRSSDRTWLVGILRHKIYDHLRRVCRAIMDSNRGDSSNGGLGRGRDSAQLRP